MTFGTTLVIGTLSKSQRILNDKWNSVLKFERTFRTLIQTLL
jgi:hypothetical protein